MEKQILKTPFARLTVGGCILSIRDSPPDQRLVVLGVVSGKGSGEAGHGLMLLELSLVSPK